MEFQLLGIKREKIKFRMPCKHCIVKAVCQTGCDNYKNFMDTYTDSYLPIYLFTIVCFLILSILILSGFIWLPLVPIIYTLMWIGMFLIAKIKYDEDIELDDFLENKWKTIICLITFAPAFLFCYMLSEEWEKYVDKNCPPNFS